MPRSIERGEHRADRRIDLGEHVAIKSAGRRAPERLACEERDVRHRMGEVEEERPAIVGRGGPLDERDGALGVARRERRLILGRHVGIDDAIPLDERQRRKRPRLRLRVVRPHVVGIRQPEVLVEAVPRGQERGMMAEVPLADRRRAVAAVAKEFGERRLGGGETVPTRRTERARDADAVGIAAGEQGGTRRRADGLRDVEVGEPHALPSEPIDVRRGRRGAAITARIAVAHVVGEDHDHVGTRRRAGRNAPRPLDAPAVLRGAVRPRPRSRMGLGLATIGCGQRAALLRDPVPFRLERRHPPRLRRGEVSCLRAVRREVVELPRRAAFGDQLPVPDPHRAVPLVAPPERLVRRRGLRIGQGSGEAPALQRRHGPAVVLHGRCDGGEFQHRRHDVDRVDGLPPERAR